MAERRHRYNHNVSERRRQGFPKVGHYDTWLVDKYQLLAEENHGAQLFPGWSNTADYADTPEKFGTVRIHSSVLAAALKTIIIAPEVKAKYTSEQRYLCESMGTPAPLLPVHREAECRLFDDIVRTTGSLDFDQMALDWCQKVNGVTIFPKLPVYLRTHYAAWQRSQRVKEAVRTAAAGAEVLTLLNETTRRELLASATPSTPLAAAPAPATLSGVTGAGTSSGASGTSGSGSGTNSGASSAGRGGQPAAYPASPFLPLVQHPPLPAAVNPVPGDAALIVGGVSVGGQPPGRPSMPRKPGQRGPCKGPRKDPRCARCLRAMDLAGALACPGRFPRGTCPRPPVVAVVPPLAPDLAFVAVLQWLLCLYVGSSSWVCSPPRPPPLSPPLSFPLFSIF